MAMRRTPLYGFMAKRKVLGCVLVLFLCFLPKIGFAARYSDHYIGLSTTLIKTDTLGLFQGEPILQDLSLDFEATYGPPFMKPFRFRAGVGFYEFTKISLIAGMEIPIFEELNDYQAKRWGVYLIPEVEIGFSRWDLALRCEVLIPLNAIGGLQIGFGINKNLHLLFSLSYSTGLYPLVK